MKGLSSAISLSPMPQTKPNNKPKISINDILNEPNKNIKITSHTYHS